MFSAYGVYFEVPIKRKYNSRSIAYALDEIECSDTIETHKLFCDPEALKKESNTVFFYYYF